jgi:preprotein translocase subunit SecA
MIEFLKRVFGTRNSREIRRMARRVAAINALEPQMQALSDVALKEQTEAFRARVRAGTSLDELLVPAFAAAREAAKRTLGLRHYDVQLIGGMALHEGRIAEMRTGEGKTLVATLPAYLNALGGGAVHIVTVNDYLARRDAEWMGAVYAALGLSVGVIQSGQRGAEKQAAYAADITYGTNNEFGFDYLRDNMAFTVRDRVQRGRDFAIVDEVDSILIDEARTPLIISGPAGESTDLYVKIDRIVPALVLQTLKENDPDAGGVEGDYTVDEKNRHIELTERGHQRVEEALVRDGLLDANDSLYAAGNLSLLHHVHAALKAHVLYRRDVDYIVQDGEVVIVDEHTGRVMQGRRWSEGIHQAIEAKERLPIQRETQTYASTTFQNYFRLYRKLSGMTGTADTEATEFRQIYNLDVLIVPTHKPMVRVDHNDLVYLTMAEKFEAVVEDINDCRARGQPVLVGTASVEASERLSAELARRGIAHDVLNAKNHAREAEIVAQAGQPGAVTIATNMAGRGTDIVLGGNLQAELAAAGELDAAREAAIRAAWQERHDAVLAAGGLHIVGTERHESRRIDNQLRGRAGRQGDPGSSRFYLSMEDNLLRIFASDRMRAFMGRLGMEKGEAIEARMVTNAIERAQRKVEQHNFDIRKNLLEFDDVANEQRRIIYAQRNELMEATDISEMLASIRAEVIDDFVSGYVPPNSLEEQWDLPGLGEALANEFGIHVPVVAWMEEDTQRNEAALRRHVLEQVEADYRDKETRAGPEIRAFEKQVMLQVLDQLWKEHLATMDHLRMGIHLRAYAQKQPKQEYKREAFELFQNLLGNVKRDVIRVLTRVRVQTEAEVAEAERLRREAAVRAMQFSHPSVDALSASAAVGPAGSGAVPAGGGPAPGGARVPQPAAAAPTFRRDLPKVGRNEPCPCGSGRKFKHCHGRSA